MTDDSPDWEELARKSLADQVERMFVNEVKSGFWELRSAFESGDSSVGSYWQFLHTLKEFTDYTESAMSQTGDWDPEKPSEQLHRKGWQLHTMLLGLGQEIEAGAVGEREFGAQDAPSQFSMGFGFQEVQEELTRIQGQLDELEREYDDGESKGARDDD